MMSTYYCSYELTTKQVIVSPVRLEGHRLSSDADTTQGTQGVTIFTSLVLINQRLFYVETSLQKMCYIR